MKLTELNKLAIKKYEALVEEKYKEPIDGKFEDVTAAILEKISGEDSDSEDSGDGTRSLYKMFHLKRIFLIIACI